jgi:hypothetical protein
LKLKPAFALLISALLLAACGDKETATKPEKKPIEKTETADHESQDNPIVAYKEHFPLTGIGTNDGAGGRAIAVMINNHPKARPQSGLSKADIVYEMLAESEITRFLAIFQSEMPRNIGPVRSARDYYIELAKGLDSLYIAHGYSPEAKEMLSQGYIDNLNGIVYDGTLFKRASYRKAPHNSYISSENIKKGAAKKEYDLSKAPAPFVFLNEDEVKALQGNAAQSVKVAYGTEAFNVTYDYDSEKQKYKRSSNGEQTVEYEKETPILLDNILIIEAPHRIIDNKGRRDINLEAGGKAYLLQKGKINEIEWKNKDGRIVPMRDNLEVGLIPGKTWVNIIPDNPGLQKAVIVE